MTFYHWFIRMKDTLFLRQEKYFLDAETKQLIMSEILANGRMMTPFWNFHIASCLKGYIFASRGYWGQLSTKEALVLATQQSWVRISTLPTSWNELWSVALWGVLLKQWTFEPHRHRKGKSVILMWQSPKFDEFTLRFFRLQTSPTFGSTWLYSATSQSLSNAAMEIFFTLCASHNYTGPVTIVNPQEARSHPVRHPCRSSNKCSPTNNAKAMHPMWKI